MRLQYESEYCSKETSDNFIKCPICKNWIPEINKIQTKFYSLIGIAAMLCLLLCLRIKAISVWKFSIEKVFQDPIAIFLLIACVVAVIIGEKTESKLKILKKGKLF